MSLGFLSPAYFAFFPITVLIYFVLPRRFKNLWLLLASWFFYLCAGTEYLPFLVGASIAVYFAARSLEKKPRKVLLAAMLLLFVGLLVLFKYLDFSVSTIRRLLSVFGLDWSPAVPELLLPAGISFYFFAAMGYLIDVYRGKRPAERSFVKSALFLSFFPSLLSGPIARADKLLPQFDEVHAFSWRETRVGLFRFAYGAFLKLIIADRLAVMVDTVFAAPSTFGSVQVIAAACAFSIQIYCDFAAYSHMAIGSARVMGFKLTENFNTPYFARSIAEFWRRWHISLSTWFRDYLYIPLGGNRKGTLRKYINVLIVFAVSGLWHGAAASFLVWGVLNGVYQVIGGITAPLRKKVRGALHLKDDGKLAALWQMLVVFVLATVAWTFFEAGSVSAALDVFKAFFSPVLLVAPLSSVGMDAKEFVVLLLGFALLLAVDIASYRHGDRAEAAADAPRALRWLMLLALLMTCVIFGSYGTGYDAQSFLYGRF